MSEVGNLMRRIRGKDSLRTAQEKTGISHNYLSILEKGVDPRTGSPIKPSPDTLKAFAKGYPEVTYEELMRVAGYIERVEESNSPYIINDQARNDAIKEVIDAYNRLPPHKQKIVDDMIKALSEE